MSAAILFLLLVVGTTAGLIVIAEDLLPPSLVPVTIMLTCYLAFGAVLALICTIVPSGGRQRG